MLPKTKPEFYKFTVDVIYAFIIGQSFLSLNSFITPFETFVINWNLILGPSLVYFIIISGWAGYTKSIIADPHWGIYGDVRYGIDLIILLIVYVMLLVSNPSSETEYGEIFLYLIPILYSFFLIWDIIQYFEIRKREKEYTHSVTDLCITIGFGALSILIGVVYLTVIQTQVWEKDLLHNINSIDYVFILIYFIHTFSYRWMKSIPEVQLDD